MKRTSIRPTTRNFTIILAGMMLCVSLLGAQTATRQRFTPADASLQEPQQKPKPTSNVDPLGILNAPEPPKTPVNPPVSGTPTSTPQTPKATTFSSSSLDHILGGSPTKRTVVIQVETKVYLSETLRGDKVFSEACLFNLIDLNGAELESGDYVSVEHVQSKKGLLIEQSSKGLVPRLGPGSGGALAKIKILKLKELNGRVKSSEGVIATDDVIILETEDEQLFTFSGFFKQLKIENPKTLRQAFRIEIFTDEASALAMARESREIEQEKGAEIARKRQARNDAFFNGIERMKNDAEQERLRQEQEAQAIAAQKEAAREEEAKQAEARRQLDNFRNAEAEAKRQRDEQAARQAAERQAAEQRAAEARLQQALSTPPRLFFPHPGETLRNGCSNHSASVTTAFTWAEVPSATAYQIYAKHSSAANPAINETVRVSQFSRTDTSFVADHFRTGWTWKVRAFINEQWGAWSEERAFQYEPMNANPACRQ